MGLVTERTAREPASQEQGDGEADCDEGVDEVAFSRDGDRTVATIPSCRTRERPSMTTLLEHILGSEAGNKLEQRTTRRIAKSGLVEPKTLEAFFMTLRLNRSGRKPFAAWDLVAE